MEIDVVLKAVTLIVSSTAGPLQNDRKKNNKIWLNGVGKTSEDEYYYKLCEKQI